VRARADRADDSALSAHAPPPTPEKHTPQSVTLHTNLGDMKIELYCEQVRAVS
jgi:hypothetical protein